MRRLPRWFWPLLLLLALLPASAWSQQPPCTPTVTLKTSVLLTWVPPVQPATITTTGYVLERQTDTGPWVELATLPLSPVTYTDATVLATHTYSYRLRATLRMGSGDTGFSGFATTDPLHPPCVTVTIGNAPTLFGLTAQ